MKKIGFGLLAIILLIAAAIFINPTIAPSHNEPFIALVDEQAAPIPKEANILQRVILFGDAGHSSLDPLQTSLKMVIQRASISPDKTAIVALGDNIYMSGYPTLDDDQTEFNEDQLESISFLDAQLEVVKQSDAKMFFVPGNHDWYASEVDSQAQHIENYSTEYIADVAFKPYNKNQVPIPQSVDLNQVSIVFIDSEWLMNANISDKKDAFTALDTILARIKFELPENLILLAAHHPLETKGPHDGYITSLRYWLVIKIIGLFYDVAAQDLSSPNYASMIDGINQITAKYDNIIHIGGHEHSLQVFRRPHDHAPEYTLVSGAANTSKVSGVWHSDNSRFAAAQEGFMELNITANGTHLSIFGINHQQAVSSFWLSF